MKNIKILMIFFLFFIVGIFPVSWNWYGSFSQSKVWWDALSPNGSGTWCQTDGDTRWWSPSFSSGPLWGTYSFDARVISDLWATLICERWDSAQPGSVFVYIDVPGKGSITTETWTNQSVGLRLLANDIWWSGVDRMILERSQNGWSFTVVWNWNNIWAANAVTAQRNYSEPFINGRSYRYRLTAIDSAWNQRISNISPILGFDSISPSLSDLGVSSPTSGGFMRASWLQNLSLTLSRSNGAPIQSVSYVFEDANSAGGNLAPVTISRPISSGLGSFSDTSTSTIFSHLFDMSDVDSQRELNNYREYTYRITGICDTAGNCSTFNKQYLYNVYADYIDDSKTQSSSPFVTEKVANGGEIVSLARVYDRYDNKILPVRHTNGSVIRSIDTEVTYSSDLYLNQYLQSGEGAVAMEMVSNVPTYTFLWVWTNMTYTDSKTIVTNPSEDYSLKTKVYTPTENNVQWLAAGDFILNTFSLATSDELWVKHQILPSPVQFNFRPFLYTQLTWEIRDNWFIEWVTQNSEIALLQNGVDQWVINKQVALEFWDSMSNTPVLPLDFSISLPSVQNIWEGNGNKTNLSILPSALGNNLDSFVLQVPGLPISTELSTYLSSHISYNLDGKEVVYNSDIIWKTNYIDGTSNGNNTFQQWLKILGQSSTSDEKYSELITGQDENVDILWAIYKGELKRDMRQAVYNFIRFLPDSTSWNLVRNNFTSFLNGGSVIGENADILYFGKNLLIDRVNISLWSAEKIVWEKTVVVVWADVYITDDIILNNKTSDIFGIIALKDDNWKWGKIYIDPNVTQIHASLYADKSVLSFDGTNELSISTPQSILKNQLYIYGTVFSENSIWGSRSNPLVCPYYKKVDPAYVCTLEESQKYDLNYLRRYILWWGIDLNGDSLISENEKLPINGGVSAVWSTSTYYSYPVVIEYNPRIQITPPPLFNKQ